MTASDLDIFRFAKQFVKRHGDEALHEALVIVDHLLEIGEEDAVDVWFSQIVAIQTIQRGPGGGLN